ncbi:hypothetical protein LZC95_20970 [Pendulispora brunnea]|uniref:Zinc-binding dehydrogenase n=1 Tax=Pendulispora brunnea TaxID=2905690 RepID=A0ABZ2KKV0_9BACT
MSKADAWFLYAGDGAGVRGHLVRETIELPALREGEVLAEPLFGCWEANMAHALERVPVDVCRLRGEEKIILGNSGVIRILEVGPGVDGLQPGQNALLYGTYGIMDRHGYPQKILGFDAPGTMGCLATRVKLNQQQVIALPEGTRFSLPQWAAFAVRYVSAWSNWRLAWGTFCLQYEDTSVPVANVWGWGGGTTLAELDLARRFGCRTVMLSGTDAHLREIQRYGITAVDRRPFGSLEYDVTRAERDPAYLARYRAGEQRFLDTVARLTEGDGVQIFVDHIGGPLQRATIKSLGRESVLATAGWKAGKRLWYLRPSACIARQQFIHTHGASRPEGIAAVAYAEANGWLPHVDERIYAFDEIPELVETYFANETGMFPCFSVAV